ncbi:hypothetical protein FRB91_004436 [Serendipita sp. 411]|nr:hypothetical protein FRC19_011349 [Serendipita sp. 401]KAG8842094.1 hypothetical protein FRB91_004436 [Serendipita sp. 411]
MFSTLISAALLLLGASQSLAAPQASATLSPSPTLCPISAYGPFKLFVEPTASNAVYPARLILNDKSLPATWTMIASTNASCTDCGVVPSYWTLKGKKLYAVDSAAVIDIPTVNKDVATSNGDLEFVTSKSATDYPIYCAVQSNPKYPPLLSVHGTTALFSMCAFTSVYPPATKFTIIYNHGNIAPVGYKCTPVNLVMQSIGIVPT